MSEPKPWTFKPLFVRSICKVARRTVDNAIYSRVLRLSFSTSSRRVELPGFVSNKLLCRKELHLTVK